MKDHRFRTLSIMVAVDKNWGFGKDGKIPWHIKEDFQHFKKTTLGSICIMGRKTYVDMNTVRFPYGNLKNEDILPNRWAVVLSSNENLHMTTGADRRNGGLGDVIKELREFDPLTPIFVIGGQSLFEEAMKLDVDSVFVSKVKGDFDCDVFFPHEMLYKYFPHETVLFEHEKFTALEYKRNES